MALFRRGAGGLDKLNLWQRASHRWSPLFLLSQLISSLKPGCSAVSSGCSRNTSYLTCTKGSRMIMNWHKILNRTSQMPPVQYLKSRFRLPYNSRSIITLAPMKGLEENKVHVIMAIRPSWPALLLSLIPFNSVSRKVDATQEAY